jgi:hypothetical protein
MNARHGLQIGLFLVGCAFGFVAAPLMQMPFAWMYCIGAVGVVITFFSNYRLENQIKRDLMEEIFQEVERMEERHRNGN